MRAIAAAAFLVILRFRLPRDVRRAALPEILRRLTPAEPPCSPSSRDVVRLRAGIEAAEAFCARTRLVADTCLYRSLARYAVWRRFGVPARFVMAIRRDSSRALAGHAWVEREGIPDGEESLDEYVVTFAFPS